VTLTHSTFFLLNLTYSLCSSLCFHLLQATYGFTGSSASKLLAVELAEATINYGSRLLQQAAAWVEERFGAKHGAKVIYGDTDSLMIELPGHTVASAMAAAHEISASVTSSLPKPITFAYEKIYYPFLLQQNKKYAGVKYTRSVLSQSCCVASYYRSVDQLPFALLFQ
jgi:DNA polymerase elongation subunit (family B)